MTGLTERFAALPAERRTRFLTRLQAQTELAARRGPVPRGDTGPVPLSYAQETLAFLGGPAGGTPLCLRLTGNLDMPALRSALASVVDRHDVLRTVIVEREGGPMQVVLPSVPVELADGPPNRPVDVTRAPAWRAGLARVAADEHLFVLDVPPILCDARSLELLVHDLAACYRGDPLPDLPVRYPDFAAWQRKRERAADRDRLAAYWRETLAGVEVLEFPADRPRGDTRTFAGESASFPVRTGWAARLDARRDDVLLAAFLVLLRRYSGLDDLVIGTPVPDRPDALSTVAGRFDELRVLRADLSGDPSFRELVRRVARVSAAAGEHGGLPLGALVDAAGPVLDPSRSPVFQIVFGTEPEQPAVDLPGLVVAREDVPTPISPVDMTWSVSGAALRIDYNTDLFDAGSIARFARHYDGLLGTLTADPDARLSTVDVLSPADRAFLAEVGQGATRPIRESTIVEEFQARVREAPDRTAVVVTGAGTSYGELNTRANRLAALLRDRGVRPGMRVGLCLRRTVDVPTAILAVLKTGAAYVPLDPAHPPARVAEIAADADLRVVIAHADTGATVSEVGAPVVTLDAVRAELAALPAGDPPPAAEPGDVAYVIYTSGSTGQPKGVLLEHRGVVNFIDSTRELFELTPADRMLGFASMTFDVSVFETFSALLTGARLCVATDDERLSINRLQALMEDAGITVIDLPPTVMPLLAPEKFTDLRIAFVGGEAFSGELVNRWNPGRRLFNGYGPTECTVTMIVEECAGTWDSSPPIGLPMTNHVAHVLDHDLRPVPVGVPGELLIGGAGLARGYLDRDELTAEKFIPDPFGTAPGGRLYRTGDLVKRLADGRLVFLGRLDQQVKIRGLRIELVEIESALTGFAGMGPVSMRARADDGGDKHLVAYLTGISEDQVPAVREHLGARLPSYMIPSYFVVLAELPLTSSGKVDWRRLPAPDLSRADDGPDESLTDTERRLLTEVLAPLLRDDRLGVGDDFFLAGGNSLQAVQLMSAINRRFGVEIALGDFFVSPTVAHLAATIDAARDSAPSVVDGRAPVVLREAGPGRVVLLHPSGGELFCYIPLVRALRPDIGIAGFRADPRDAAGAPADALPATAARIARALIAGGMPDCLAGWSYGGVLAFEIARQIERETGQRPALVLLDSAYDEESVLLDEPMVRQRFVHDVARLAGYDGPAVRAVLADPAAGTADVRATLTALGVELELTGPELAARFATFRSCALSLQDYRPPGAYGGPVTVLTAGPQAAMEEQWRAVCTGPFRAGSVPADHYTLFAEPALGRVVAAIDTMLAS